MAFSTGLTNAQRERLAVLIEEMGEALQSAGKVMRHGYASYHPDNASGPDNRESLEKELGDVRYAMDLMCTANDVDRLSIMRFAQKKASKVVQYLHYQSQRLLTQAAQAFER